MLVAIKRSKYMYTALKNNFAMQGKSQQEKFYHKCWRELRKHFGEFNATFDPEEIHRLRVAVKKINSLFYFLEKCRGDESAAEIFKPVKKIFKHAGLIRSACLNLQLISRYRIPCPELKEEQKKIQQEQTGSFLSVEEEYLALIIKAYSLPFKKLKSKCIRKVYRRELEELALFFEGDVPENQLHEYRKKIKVLLYMHEGLNNKLLSKLNLNTEYLGKLQETIGRWHDATVTVELLTDKGYTDAKFTARPEREIRRLLDVIKSMTAGMRDKVFLEAGELVHRV